MDERDAKGQKTGQRLDALATGWACVKGKGQNFVAVWYNTGGNCEECEWQELIGVNGQAVASTRPKTKKNLATYEKAWLSRRLPAISPDGFEDIPLRDLPGQ